MYKLDLKKQTREKIKAKLEKLNEQYINAGSGTEGDIKNSINLFEGKLDEIEHEITLLEEAKLPDQLNVKIFVIANYSDNIKKYIPEDVFYKVPSDRNPNENIENWIPYYDSKKTIKKLLDEFRDAEKYQFNVIYLTGHDNKDYLEGIIDDSITDKSAIGIIDLLSVNEINRDLAKRFDTRSVKSTILPICRKLPMVVQDFMLDSQMKLFSLSNNKFKNERCCFFSKTYEEDGLIQQLRRVYSSNWRLKNEISDDGDKFNDIRDININII
jgi:hypothetical protein